MGAEMGREVSPLVVMNSVAPREIASAFLESVCENTTTSQPIFAAN